jgi:hypothetical protein
MDATTVAAPGVILQVQFLNSTVTALQPADVTTRVGVTILRAPVVLKLAP